MSAFGLAPGEAYAAFDDDIPGRPLTLGTTVTDVVDPATDTNDVWAVDLTEGAEVRVTVAPTVTGRTYSYDVFVLAPGSTSIQSDSFYSQVAYDTGYMYSILGDDPAVLDFVPARSGRYYVWIKARYDNAPYTLKCARTPRPAFTTPDADDLWGVPTGGGSTDGVVDPANDTDDVYAVRFRSGSPIRLTVAPTVTGRTYSYDVFVLAPGSTSIQSDSFYSQVAHDTGYMYSILGDDPAVFDFVPASSGVYHVWIRARSDNAPYRMTIVGEAEKPPMLRRLAGNSRYSTAVAISRANFASASTVVIATGADFADALAGSGLAGAYNGPVLLTQPTALPSEVATEIDRLRASKVVILGGPTAVSPVVENALRARGKAVQRISGADRYATAAAVAREIRRIKGGSFTTTALIARGDHYADALAGSALAFSQDMPILLVRPNSLPSATASAIRDLGIKNAVVVGGTSAVSDAVRSSLGVPATRVSGSDRYQTASKIAEFGVNKGWASYAFVGLATGENFPDALGGGVASGKRGGVLLLTRSAELSSSAYDAFHRHADSVLNVQVYGGIGAVNSACIGGIARAF